MKNESVKKSLEKSKSVLEEKHKNGPLEKSQTATNKNFTHYKRQ